MTDGRCCTTKAALSSTVGCCLLLPLIKSPPEQATRTGCDITAALLWGEVDE